MLYYAWRSEPERQHGRRLDVSPGADSAFAPPGPLLAGYEAGRWGWGYLMHRYRQELQARWRRDRQAFLDVVAQAAAGDVTLVCGYDRRHLDDAYAAAPRCYCLGLLWMLYALAADAGTPIEPPGLFTYELRTGPDALRDG